MSDYRELSKSESIKIIENDTRKLKHVVSSSAFMIERHLEQLSNDPAEFKRFGQIVGGDVDDYIAKAKEWQHGGGILEKTGSVGVTAAKQNHDGRAVMGGGAITINEEYLANSHTKGRFSGVIRHELIHSIFNLPDYAPGFIYLLNLMSKSLPMPQSKAQIVDIGSFQSEKNPNLQEKDLYALQSKMLYSIDQIIRKR